MNYDQPRQIVDGPDAGKWRYTSHNNRTGTYAIGYCRDGCPGHETKEGAYEHQRQYELDNARYGVNLGSWHPCQVCGAITNLAAITGGYSIVHLCDQHQNRESLDPFVLAGNSIHS